jgi:hypothetical protein
LSRFLRICNQSLQKVLIRAKKISCIQKIQFGYQKTQNFKSVEKVLQKMHHKKVISKNMMEKTLFFTFYSCSSTSFCL